MNSKKNIESGSLINKHVAVPPGLEHNLGFLLNKAARIMREDVAESLKPLSLTFQEYVILRMIDHQIVDTQHELAVRNDIDRTTMVDLIDRLEERELLTRQKDTLDRRKYKILMTTKGRKTLTHAKRLTEKAQKKLIEPLSEVELTVVKEALIKLISVRP
jgi:DNA-binding MarR family transcriptional regulator